MSKDHLNTSNLKQEKNKSKPVQTNKRQKHESDTD